MRNVWSHSIIICGHFPEGVETFEKRSIEGETRGDWYVRQMLGSANISGSKAMHIMSGNLSHQIEHHLFPDLPSNRYAEIAPKVQALFEKYDLNYHTAPMYKQVASAWHKVIRLSLPNGWMATTKPSNATEQLATLYKMSTGGPRIRRAAQARLNQLARRARLTPVELGARTVELGVRGIQSAAHARLTCRAGPTQRRAAETTSRASSWTRARCSGPWNDSA